MQRLVRDFRTMQADPPAGVDASPDPNNILQWRAVIFGPDGTIWEDGIFKLSLNFTEEYPHKAPDVRFVSKIFHPNGAQLHKLMQGSGWCACSRGCSARPWQQLACVV